MDYLLCVFIFNKINFTNGFFIFNYLYVFIQNFVVGRCFINSATIFSTKWPNLMVGSWNSKSVVRCNSDKSKFVYPYKSKLFALLLMLSLTCFHCNYFIIDVFLFKNLFFPARILHILFKPNVFNTKQSKYNFNFIFYYDNLQHYYKVITDFAY
jgi:hypothetical protein